MLRGPLKGTSTVGYTPTADTYPLVQQHKKKYIQVKSNYSLHSENLNTTTLNGDTAASVIMLDGNRCHLVGSALDANCSPRDSSILYNLQHHK